MIHFLISFWVVVSFASFQPPSYAYDDFQAVKSFALPGKYKTQLISKGHEILQAILTRKIDKIAPALPVITGIPNKIKQKTAFNLLGEQAPSAWIRWYLEKDNPTLQEYLAKIICLGWALDDLAVKQGDSFTRGSFTVIDPNYLVYDFLKGYVCLVNGIGPMEQLPWALTFSNMAYRRDPASNGSSHHKDQTTGSQFGIDIRFRGHETVYGLLPHLMRHILFGKLNIVSSSLPLTFIKFEPTGLGSSMEIASHALNYFSPVTTISEKRREKDIPEEIWTTFKILTKFGGDDQNPEIDEEKLKIHEILDHVHFRIHPTDALTMTETVKKYYPNDPLLLLQVRTGNEVILDLRDKEDSAKTED